MEIFLLLGIFAGMVVFAFLLIANGILFSVECTHEKAVLHTDQDGKTKMYCINCGQEVL